MAVGGVMTASDQIALAVAGRLLSGIGGIAMSIMLTKMITDWFVGKEIVTAMSILIASWPLGIGFAFLLFPPLAAAWSWHVVMLLAATFAVVCLGVVAVFYRDPPDVPQTATGALRIELSRREWVLAIAAGMIWAGFNVGFIVLVNFSPELFTRRGYSHEAAGAIVSLLGWGTIPLVPLAGFAVERFKRPDLFMTVGFLAWFTGMHLLFSFNTVQSGEGVGNEFLYIIAAVIGGCLLTGGFGSAVGSAMGAFIFGMATQGIVYAGWNPDWFRSFLGLMLLLATVTNLWVRQVASRR